MSKHRNLGIIARVRATPVRVRAKPDSLNSDGIDESDEREAAFAKKFRTGGHWADFADQVKYIVEMETAAGLMGIGETYRSVEEEPVRKALASLPGKDVLSLPWRFLPVADLRVYDAVESAVLDLAGRLLDMPVYQLLGGAVRDRVDCSGWTGRRTPADAARKAYEAHAKGHRVFKFKCSDSDSMEAWFKAIKEKCGAKIKIILDPNQRWNDVATTLRMLEGIPRDMLLCLEDPISRSDYAGFREIRKRAKVPVFMHVSVPYLHQGQRAEDALVALREECVDGFNFNGPMFRFVELARVAEMAGLACWHGSEVDLGILEASALHAAAAARSCTVPSDVFGELVREDDLIEEGIRFENGYALVPKGPGLGVSLDRKALERHRIGETLEFKEG